MSLAVKKWAQFAGGEGVESAEAASEFGVAQAALAIKAAEKVDAGEFSFLGIAFHAARDQIAVRIACELRLGHNVVQVASLGHKLTQAIKATATLSCVDGPPEGCGLQEILSLGIDGGEKTERDGATGSIRPIGACSKDLVRQEHLNHMSGFAALHKAQEATRDEATDGPARRVAAKTDTARKPRNRKSETWLSFQP